MKNVQIPEDLFKKLVAFHLNGDRFLADEIKQGLQEKQRALRKRELYTRSKTAPTIEEQEIASLQYLEECELSDGDWFTYVRP